MSALTDAQTALLAAPLDKERVKQRQGRGSSSLSYIEGHDAIRTANAIFGFGQWGHEITDLRLLQGVAVTSKEGKPGIHVGYVCIVRLTIAGCVPVSGIGYGDAVEYTPAAPVTAHELAAKEAESDALKRALKNYGDQFGLALYDKQAASSGHLTSGAAATSSFTASPLAPTDVQIAKFAALAAEWKSITPDFAAEEAVDTAKAKDRAWVQRATTRLEDNIRQSSVAV